MDFETLGQLWPLQSGSTNEPALTAGKQTTFQFNDVPDRAPSGPLAYYLPGCKVTFRGTAVAAGGEGAQAYYTDQFYQLLFEKLVWLQTFFGTPIQGQNVTGAQWAAIEYISNGYRYEQQPREVVSTTAGSYPFEVEIFVPFASCLLEGLEENTSQLALLARSSQLQIVAGPLAGNGGVTLTGVTATASAALVPRQELIFGTPIETVLSTIVAGAGTSVKITNFGTDTGINGVDPGGGVLSLLALTNVSPFGGSFDAQNLTQFQFNWRGQQQTQDILGLLTMWRRLLPSNQNVQVIPAAGAANMQGFPYLVGNPTSNSPAPNANEELANLICWPIVLPGQKVRLTSLQTASSDETFNMTVTGGFDSGSSHQLLGNYARSWQERMVAAWISQITAGDGGSLAAYVLGPDYLKAKPSRRAPAKHSLSNDQLRYLPWQLTL